VQVEHRFADLLRMMSGAGAEVIWLLSTSAHTCTMNWSIPEVTGRCARDEH